MTYIRPDVKILLDMLAAQPGPQMHEGDPATARQMMRMMGQLADARRGELARVEDFTIPSPHGHAIPARLYSAVASPAAGPVLVFYHGGGWVIGDLETHDPLCAEIARVLGLTVVSVDYRLAPEHPFPAATEDCLTATHWLAGSPAIVGHPVTGLIPAGDSAGGNLAAVITQQQHGQLAVPIIAQWLIYPGVDMTANAGSMQEFAEGYLLSFEGMRWFTQHYMGATPDFTHAYASPLHVASLAGLPPAMVFTCGLDPLRDQGRAYAAKLVQHGVRTVFREAAGQIHGCMNLRGAIPSTNADLHGCLSDLRLLIDEATTSRSAQLAEAAE
ncbi:alpha/beta hydrolase [Glacieibacterium sp.]|uniref:alpha/beta hydrolase n=1 Tax=Glacieibacterium sp. TaxID=2860237 RepID=UPI003B00C9DF